MKKIISLSCFAILLLTFVLRIVSCEASDRQEKVTGQDLLISSDFINPAYRANAPDPSVIRSLNGMYYAYTTNARILESQDLVNWQRINDVFEGTAYPDWLAGGAVWATDINFIDGRYVLYYALSKWGEQLKNGIGVATSLEPGGPFSDHGAMFTSEDIGVRNSIDPCYHYHEGKHYLAWGSWHGIWLAELTADALHVNESVPLKQIAGTAFEAPMIFLRDGYYYLFCSIGSCCQGLESTYHTVVGRSESPFGPYVDKEGRTMLENNYELLLSGNEHFVGPGHNSEIVTDYEGKTWFLYHAYVVADPRAKRCVMLDEVEWDADGWPYVSGGSPSCSLNDGPVLKIKEL